MTAPFSYTRSDDGELLMVLLFLPLFDDALAERRKFRKNTINGMMKVEKFD